MWPLQSTKPIAEYEASDVIDEIYHDIRQSLRVTGVNLVFRALAGFPHALPVIWEAVAPAVSTQGFEHAANDLRAKAVKHAASFGNLEVHEAIHLGPSQAYQIQKALALYHYIIRNYCSWCRPYVWP